MKIKNLLLTGLLLFGLFGFNQLNAQLVKEATITAGEANFQMIAPNSYLMEIGGPDNYYFRQEVEYTQQLSISNVKADGEKFADGTYMMQVTPIIMLTEEEKVTINTIREQNDYAKMAEFRKEHNLPDQVSVYNINFSIRDGKFISPDNKEVRNLKAPAMSDEWHQDHPAFYASIENVSVNYGKPMAIETLANATDNSALSEDDQVFFDDVIVVGSICVGQDCVNGENFGFDTGRYKENNLRVHFDDTSVSASFPKNDWRIAINDTSNGGASYFAIEDATAGTTPFRVRAGAGNNALYISNSGGNVGMGTATPVVELHITDGDSPTMRLEQDGSAGFGQQTWDVAGNETNFFVRDVTNGSKLPFKIKPGAPDNSLFIKGDGQIGLGTQNPTHKLQVESGNLWVKSGKVGIKIEPTAFDFEVLGNSQFSGNVIFKNGDPSFFLTNGISFLNSSFLTVMRVDAPNRRVGIAINGSPAYALEVCGTIATTAAMVTTGITCSSDARFKENVQTLSGSLEKLVQLRGVKFDWKKDEFPDKGFTADRQIGFIAQEVEALYPELVLEDAHGYKLVDYTKMTPILVEAVKAQQKIIDGQQKEIASLQSELAELQGLKAQVAALAEMVSSLNETASLKEVEVEVVGDKK